MDNTLKISLLEEENKILKSQCEFWEKLYRKDTDDLIKQRDELAEKLKQFEQNFSKGNMRHV